MAREAVSAMLDGEDPGVAGSDVDLHLESCEECREWRDAAHEVTRRARLVVAPPVPRRAGEVAAAVRARTGRRWRLRPGMLPRLGLVAVAAGELAITVPCLLLGQDRSAPVHIAHEMGSFDAALAVGFLVAAWRPGRALGMRALVGAAAALLVATAVIDLLTGRTTLSDEAPHLLVVAGWLMIHRLAVITPPAVARPRPALTGGLWARLRSSVWAPAWDGARPPAGAAFTANGGDRSAATPMLGMGGGSPAGEALAACGCTTGRCACPGCGAGGHAAAG